MHQSGVARQDRRSSEFIGGQIPDYRPAPRASASENQFVFTSTFLGFPVKFPAAFCFASSLILILFTTWIAPAVFAIRVAAASDVNMRDPKVRAVLFGQRAR